ncbi:hypothetical protein [Novosphingobium sp. B 225]|uniref:hypothetical protein n=1 Tax=Novosphingobium sp. B 225 TaxID=1961849 RepID=UPI000B4C16E7|nr:hypothetical protein [Novosphingobium sp. B 225]
MTTPNDDLARTRFLFLNLIRLGSVALVLFGLTIASGKLGWPEWIGMVLVAAGAAEFFLLPMMLAKRWKSPDQ